MSNQAKNFRIPKSFTLFGHKYTVEFDDDLHEKEDCYGSACDNRKLITIQTKKKVFSIEKIKDSKGNDIEKKEYYDITDELVVETFYHELVHVILYAMDETKLNDNEKFVNMMGKAFLEIYLTSEYTEPVKV